MPDIPLDCKFPWDSVFPLERDGVVGVLAASPGLQKRELYAAVAMHAMLQAGYQNASKMHVNHIKMFFSQLPITAFEVADGMCKQSKEQAV